MLPAARGCVYVVPDKHAAAERSLVSGRIDSERYRWSRRSDAPPPVELSQAAREVVDLVLQFAGPITGKELADFVGVPQRVIKEALATAGAVIGFWEYDPDLERVVYGTLGAPPRGAKSALAREAAAVTAVLRDELGHGRAFSLDTDASVQRRAAWIRGLSWSK
ncbi:MAG: hypothetical protein AAF721_09505 [Myxococcota bacterium]